MCAAIIAGAFGLDRVTKIAAVSRLPDGTVRLLGSFLGLTKHQNYGLLANLPVPQWIIVATTSFVILAIIWKIVSEILDRRNDATTSDARSFALSLIVGGALGNLFDRMTHGFVVDWILLFNRSVINVADIAIAAGIAWYLFQLSRGSTKSCLFTHGKDTPLPLFDK